ncbi:hydroxymethylbilane synthase [Candidatus Bathyarchaeota archaeon]|nr:MAG: hydroxymethylbilane synthase [Candidatus Bathyarchaeota archaeon]
MLLRVGTRGSKLSLVQTDIVLDQLKRKDPKLVVERKIIKTRGDEDQRTPIFSINQKGIFEKEIDQAILERKIDVAVHSLKDVPVFEVDTKLVIASVPQRGSPSNVLVSKNSERLEELKSGSRVGTSSLLRVAQLKRVRPDLQPVPIRGNVDTRVQKVEDGEFDAVILAEAGLLRLGLTGRIAGRLSLDDFMPAPGQGILALIARQDNKKVIVVARQDNGKVLEFLQSIEDPPTRAQADAERELVNVLEGGCKVPIGALASSNRDSLYVTGCILSNDGKTRLESKKSGNIKEAAGLGREVAEELISKGAKKIEETWRGSYYRD